MVGQGPGQTRGVDSVWASAVTVFSFLLIGHVIASSPAAPQKQGVAPSVSLPDIVFVQTPQITSGLLTQRFPQGSSIVRLVSSAKQNSVVNLTDGFFAAADPQVNFDGSRILFSGRKEQSDHWQIWEMNLDGSNKRQVTPCAEDCLRGAYLPADEIAFTVETMKGRQLLSYLAVAKTDGSGLHRITFGSALFQLETVLRDGRIVASAPWPLRAAAESDGSRLLYTLRPDGTALESFRCEHRRTTSLSDAAELTDGTLVFIRKAPAGATLGGELVQIKQGDPGTTPSSLRQALYQSPRQVADGDLILAKQALGATNQAGRFDLYLFDLKTGTLGARLYSDPLRSSIQPVPVVPRTTPKHYWNTLNPESSTGNFISLNSYLSADETRGRIAAPISHVRVFGLSPSDGTERNLGEAPVEADGSFFVKVPANLPIRFVLLDEKGKIIREQHGWVWTRPGEQRGCTGCHGDKAVAPENHWPQTLRRFDTPTPLGETEHASASSQAK